MRVVRVYFKRLIQGFLIEYDKSSLARGQFAPQRSKLLVECLPRLQSLTLESYSTTATRAKVVPAIFASQDFRLYGIGAIAR
jgi:hypothetical protein